MKTDELINIIEAILLVAEQPVPLQKLQKIGGANLDEDSVNKALELLRQRHKNHGFKLKQVASGFRFQVCEHYNHWVEEVINDRNLKFSKAVLEVLAIIAYKQPVTRGDIERMRGVSISGSTIHILLARQLVKISGYRATPGKPALYITTRQFLDYFELSSLEQLPSRPQVQQKKLL